MIYYGRPGRSPPTSKNASSA